MVRWLCAVNSAESVDDVILAGARALREATKAHRVTMLVASKEGAELTARLRWNGQVAEQEWVDSKRDGDQENMQLARELQALLGGVLVVKRNSHRNDRDTPLASDCTTIVLPMKDNGDLRGAALLEFQDGLSEHNVDDSGLTLLGGLIGVAMRRAATLDGLRRKVDDLSTLLALNEAMPRTIGFDEVLRQIVRRVELLLGAESCGLWLHDSEKNELVPSVLTDGRMLKEVNLPVDGGGIAVEVFRTGKAYLCNDLSSDSLALQPYVQRFAVRRSITVPLEADGKRIGVAQILNKLHGDFTEDDLRVLLVLASHLGVLIQNAQLLENERESAAKMQALKELIQEQREGVQRTLTIHDEFTKMVLESRGIPAIIGTLGRLLGNPVAVEDRFFRLIGYYHDGDDAALDEGRRRLLAQKGTPLGLHDDPEVKALRQRLTRERLPLRMAPIPRLGFEIARLVVPVLVGREMLGSVYVLESNRVLDDVDLVAVERAATAIALEMMKEKAAAEAQYKLVGDLVGELLGGHYGQDDVLLSRAAYLGLDLLVPRVVMVAQIDTLANVARELEGEEDVLSLRAKLLDIVERACRQTSREAMVSTRSDEVVILAKARPRDLGDRWAEARKLADAIRADVNRWLPEISISVGMGRPCDSLPEYARSYQQAKYVLDVLKASHQTDRTITFDELGIYGVLFAPENRERLLGLVEDALGGLVAYDKKHGSQLTATLDQYLVHDGHLERTASALHIHLNTLRYRIQRIEQIAGVELRSFEAKFNLQLALKIWRTLKPM